MYLCNAYIYIISYITHIFYFNHLGESALVSGQFVTEATKRILICCPKINEHSGPWIRRLAAYSYRFGLITCVLRFR